MPNWCENKLTIFVPSKKMSQLKAKLFSTVSTINLREGIETETIDLSLALDFHLIAPMPNSQFDDWYEWRRLNWGVKWLPTLHHNGILISDSDGSDYGKIQCCFDTPWNPPVAWFYKLNEAFPDCWMSLKYFEPGNCFAGEYYSEDYDSAALIDWDCPDDEMKNYVLSEFGWDFDDEEENMVIIV